jgi:hypothetical protein
MYFTEVEFQNLNFLQFKMMISAMNQSVITRSGSQRLTGMQLWRMPITYYTVAAKFGLQTVLQC